MEDYNRELGWDASESRYAEIRALREQRNATRANAPEAKKKPRRESPLRAKELPPWDDSPDIEENDDIFAERPKGAFGRVLLTQVIVCALLLGGLLLAQKAMPNTYAQLRRSYTQVMQKDMSAKEVWAAAVAVFRSIKDEIYVVAPYNDAQAAQQPTTSPDASGEPGGSGGIDVATAYAAKSCTAVPLLTTARPARPVAEGYITSPFGYRVHPITGEEGIHTGLDIGAQEGEPIFAAFYGTVKEVGKGEQFGNYIVLEHAGGLKTVYAHCSEILAEEGMVLRAGDVIALVGSTGSSTGPHLHFEVRLHNLRCDPVPLFAAADMYPYKDAEGAAQ